MIFENEIDNDESGNIPPSSNEDGASENEDSADISQHEEAAAKARGWISKDEYRGKPEDWQDAKSFLDRNSSLKTEVESLRDRIGQQEEAYAERLKRLESTNDRIIREDRDRLLRELARAKRAAVELGDTDEYDRLEREEHDYFSRQVEHERQERQPQKQQEQQPLLPETQEWLRRNSWFHETPAMQQIALGFYEEAKEGHPATRDESKRLAYVDKRMKEVYPDKFGDGNRSNSVEGGSRNTPSGNSNKMSNLPPEARAACRKFIAKGIIKNEAEYIKYWLENE